MRSILVAAVVLAVGCGGEIDANGDARQPPNYAGDWRVVARGSITQHFTMRLFQVSDLEYHGRISDVSGDRFVIVRAGGPFPAFCVMPASDVECDYGFVKTLREELDTPLTLTGHATRWNGHDEQLSEVVSIEMTHL